MGFQNNPNLRDEDNNGKVKRYVHQPLTVEHYGLHAKIKENGKVVITGVPTKLPNGEFEYDEVEVPASFVFKLTTLLKATRTIKFVSVQEAATMPAEADAE